MQINHQLSFETKSLFYFNFRMGRAHWIFGCRPCQE